MTVIAEPPEFCLDATGMGDLLPVRLQVSEHWQGKRIKKTARVPDWR